MSEPSKSDSCTGNHSQAGAVRVWVNGERVFVRFGDGSKGLMAAEVRLADMALPHSH